MSEQTPFLILDPGATQLQAQVESWLAICTLSETIAAKVQEQAWDDVLSMADARDSQVDAFFKAGVPRCLLPQVMSDVDRMKQLHHRIMQLLENKQQENHQTEDFLVSVKQEIERLSPADQETWQQSDP